jgi:oligopeptide transport system ATP-binding protein
MDKNSETVLRVEHLSQHFDLKGSVLKAVDDISFNIYKGEVFGLVGESGCGKTTTGRTIIRLYNATFGSIYLNDKLITADIKLLTQEKLELRKTIAADQIRLQQSEAAIAALRQRIAEAKQKVSGSDLQTEDQTEDQTAEIAIIADSEKRLNELTVRKQQMQKTIGENKEKYAAILRKIAYGKKINRKRYVPGIQMIFQDPVASLNPRMTVYEIIAEGLIIQGLQDDEQTIAKRSKMVALQTKYKNMFITVEDKKSREAKDMQQQIATLKRDVSLKQRISDKVAAVLSLVGLVPEHANRYPHEFSGGQRQRIGIARALVLSPSLLIADEPISALDVSIQAQIISLLNELRDKIGLTIMFIAHNMSVVKYFCDRIGVMYYGKLVETASTADLFAHPLHPYTRALLSAIPYPDPNIEKNRIRVIYNPITEHDYRTDKPTLREVYPGHIVYCNEKEYQENIEKMKNER